MNVQNLINLALQDINAIASGQTPSVIESQDAFDTLNQIVASWSNEQLIVFNQVHGTFSVTAATAAYTMGPGATWATSARPMAILGAVAFSGNFQQGLEILPMKDLRPRMKNGTGVTSALPDLLGYDNATPQVNVRLYPTPDVNGSIEADYWTALTAFAALTDAIALPQGFELALRSALAVARHPSYRYRVGELSAALVTNADRAKAAIMALNAAITGAAGQAAQ
jgi:hypothetical protein